MDNPLLAKIETSASLPTLPHILLELIDVCHREEKGIRDLSKIINQDPSLSERVLRLVNSAYYSLKQKIVSIEQALLLLGMDAVKNIALSSSIHQVFHRPKKESAFDLKLFWWHSLNCAALARSLAVRSGYPAPDEAFLSGLMHDIGKIVLWVNFEEQYEAILKSSGYRSEALLRGEQELGLTHAEVGSWLIRRWDLRSFLPDALLYHHDSRERVAHALPLVKIVYAANRLCPIATEEAADGYAAASLLLGLSEQELRALAEKAEEEVRGIASSLDIEIAAPDQERWGLSDRDQEKYDELAAWVRDFSLLQSSSEAFLKAEDRTAILQITRQGLQLLFDLSQAFFFEYRDDALHGLAMSSEDKEDVIRELAIPFREESSLLVRALAQARIVDSFDVSGPLSILDEQLTRFLGGQGMLCLPMAVGKELLGVLLLGIRRDQRDLLRRKRTLLTMFLNLCSLAMYGLQVKDKQVERIREERLSATSLLARKVVHEAHNPLGIITNYLGILETKLKEDVTARDDLRIVREELRRVSQIIGELFNFSTPPQMVREPVAVNAILRDLAQISQESLAEKAGIRLDLALESKIPLVKSDKNRLKQVFINLLKNAVEAMPGGGTITVSTRYREGKPPVIEVQIRDQGGGIPPEIEGQLFEPFTTSKGHEGLGLAIVYNIAKELGCTLSYQSGESGTTFQVRIPVE